MSLLVSESFVNTTRGHRFGDSEPYKSYTDNVGKLFAAMQREYGRCTGKVYVDTLAEATPVGWVFQKRMQYEDYRGHGERFYIREVWVTLHDSVDTVKRTHHYHQLDAK